MTFAECILYAKFHMSLLQYQVIVLLLLTLRLECLFFFLFDVGNFICSFYMYEGKLNLFIKFVLFN